MKNILLDLKPNEILVVETDIQGLHLRGMSKFANENLGAIEGIAEGLSGQTYLLPIRDIALQKISDYEIEGAINRFKKFAFENKNLRFYLTRIGSETAGINMNKIKELFKVVPENVIKPNH